MVLDARQDADLVNSGLAAQSVQPICFTVAIPTYNGAERLPLLLERLRSQRGVESLSWEVLVIDNNSIDATAAVVADRQADWQADCPKNGGLAVPLRYCFEPRPGAAYARQQAIQQAQGDWIGFLDDDCWPNPDWVKAAYDFALAHPQVGAFGGQIHPRYEVEPAAEFQRFQSFLAIRQGGCPTRYRPEVLDLPPAAALVVRKSAWQSCVPAQPALGGKVGDVMIQGDDYEPLMHLHRAGWEIWYAPSLQAEHQIPAWRLEPEYFKRLIHGSCLCICQLRLIITPRWRQPWMMLKVAAGSLRRAGRHWLRHRGQFQTNWIAMWELEWHLSTFWSPFFYLSTRLRSGQRSQRRIDP